jgi:hypothetical protein
MIHLSYASRRAWQAMIERLAFGIAAPGVQGRGKRVRHRKLSLEVLEDRTVPAVWEVVYGGGAGAETLPDILNSFALPDAEKGISDTIVFDPRLNGSTIDLIDGGLDITSAGAFQGAGGTITIDGEGEITIDTSVDNAQFDGAAISVQAGAHLVLTGLEFRGADNVISGQGGAIDNIGGDVTVNDCTFLANSATSGGAIYNSGTTTVNDCTFLGNAALSGGAIYNSGTLNVNDGSMTGNTATGNGGAIANSGMLDVNGGILTENTALVGGGIANTINATAKISTTVSDNFAIGQRNASGGGLYNYGGNMTVLDATVENNSSSDIGGGITNDGGGTLTVEGSTLTGNQATTIDGGAIWNNGTLSVTASTLAGNSAGASGGAVYDNGGQVTLTGSAVSSNSAINGGAMLVAAQASATVDGNSQLTGNRASNDGGALYNAAGGTLTVNSSTLSDNVATQGGAIENLQNLTMAGSTFTGNKATAADGGAVWSSSSLVASDCTFTNNAAAGYGGAVVADDGTVTVSSSTFAGNLATNGGVMMVAYNTTATLDRDCQLSGNKASNFGGAVFIAAGGSFTDSGSLLTGNSAQDGGAVYDFGGTATLGNSTLTANSADFGGALMFGNLAIVFVEAGCMFSGNTATIFGGAIYNQAGTLTVKASTLSANTAQAGGAIYNLHALTLQGTTVSGNDATVGDGGGIWTGDILKLSNDILSNNTAGNRGGAIYNDTFTDTTVIGATISGNTAGATGGGIENLGAMTVTQATLSGNTGAQGGGGIDNSGPHLTLTESTLSGNVTANAGGAIANEPGQSPTGQGGASQVFVIDCTISGNTASMGGGISTASAGSGQNGGGSGFFDLGNTIVAGNTAGVDADLAGEFSGKNCLIGDGTGETGININDGRDDMVGTSASPIDPLLAPLSDYGAGRQAQPLKEGSPAVNAGGVVTFLNSSIGGPGTSFDLFSNATIAVTAGTYVLSVDGEEIKAVFDPASGFTVVQRGYNNTPQAAQINPQDAVFLALDDNGRPRVVNGQTDIGAVQDTVLVVTSNPAVAAVNAGQTASFTATAHSDEPIISVEWLVSSDGGNSFRAIGSGNTSTTTDGAASSTLQVLNTTPQEDGNIYEAEFGNTFGTVTGTPAALTVHFVPPPATIAAAGGDGQESPIRFAFNGGLTALVTDARGNPVAGVPVTFTAPSSPQAGGTFAGSGNSCVVTTTSLGYAYSPIFTANATPGVNYSVVATVGSGAGPLATTFHLTNYIPGAPAAVEAQGSTSVTIAAGQQEPTGFLEVQVTDAQGRPVPGATVTYTATTNTTTKASATPATIKAITNINGLAVPSGFAPNSHLGSYIVNATVAGVATPASFTVTNVAGPPKTILVVGSAKLTGTVGSSLGTLSVKVEDASGNLIAGIPVTFTVSSNSAAGGNIAGSSTASVTTGTTGSALGVATSPTFTANQSAGVYSITVAAGTLSTSLYTVTNNPDQPSIISVYGNPPTSALVGQLFSSPLSVLVTDRFNNTVNGVNVTFTAPTSGPSGIFANNKTSISATTGSGQGIAGVAGELFAANAIPSGPNAPSYLVIASFTVGTSTQSVNFVLSNLSPTNSVKQSSVLVPAAPLPRNVSFTSVAGRAEVNSSTRASVNFTTPGQAVALAARRQANGNMYVAFLAAVAGPDGGTEYVASIWLHQGNKWRRLSADTVAGSAGQGTLEFTLTGQSLQLDWTAAGQSQSTRVGSARDGTLKSGTSALGTLEGAEVADILVQAGAR